MVNKNSLKISLIFLVLFGIIGLTQAQDTQLLFEKNFRMAKWLDPSYVKQDTGWTIVLPGLDYRTQHSGPSLNDLIVNEGAGVYSLNLAGQIDNFDTEEHLLGELGVSIFALELRKGSQQFGIGYNVNVQSQLVYKKGLVQIFELGNAPFIGETMDLGPDFLINSFHEIYLSYAKKSGKLSYGVRLKYLSGIEDISTSGSTIQLYTDPEIYQLTTTTDYVVNSSGAFDYRSLQDFDVNFDPLSFNNFGRNTGYAVDLGISLDLSEQFSLGIAALDLGKINWAFNISNQTSRGVNEFGGLDILDFLDDNNDIVVEDSIKQLLEFEQTREAYSNALFAKYYVHANYQLSDKFALGALINYHKAKASSTGYALNANYRPTNNFSLNTQLGFFDQQATLGLGLNLNAGPSSFYVGLDNLLSLFGVSNYASGRFAWSLSF